MLYNSFETKKTFTSDEQTLNVCNNLLDFAYNNLINFVVTYRNHHIENH